MSYVGPLLDPSAPDPALVASECGGGWQHSTAVHRALSAVCLGNWVTLTRRKLTPTREEIPGVVEGICYGSSHELGGRVVLALHLDSGENVGVDVSDPADWVWEVGRG